MEFSTSVGRVGGTAVLTGDKVFNVTAGTSTLASIMCPSDKTVVLEGSMDSPLAYVGGTTVVRIGTAASAAAATVSYRISGVVNPKIEALETK